MGTLKWRVPRPNFGEAREWALALPERQPLSEPTLLGGGLEQLFTDVRHQNNLVRLVIGGANGAALV